MQVNVVDDVSGNTVGPETSSTKLTCTPCKTPKRKYQLENVFRKGKMSFIHVLYPYIEKSCIEIRS